MAYQIARSSKPHTTAEELVLLAALNMVSVTIGKSAAKQLYSVPLSNNTISRRINDMSDDITDQITDILIQLNFYLPIIINTNNMSRLLCRIFKISLLQYSYYSNHYLT